MKRIKHMTLDFTTLCAYRTCPTKFKYSLLHGWRPETASDPLVFGQCIHEALACYHETGNPQATLGKFESVANETHLKELEPSAMRSVAHGTALLTEYFKQYENDAFGQFRPLMTKEQKPTLELKLETDINEWLTYDGLCDGVVSDTATGEHKGLEHKTSYVLGTQFANRMKPNDQLTGYVYLLQKNGYDIDTIVANGLQTARKKIETNPRDCFSRHETRRTPIELHEWREKLVRAASRMKADIETGLFDSNMPDACSMWNTRCSFTDVCNIAPQDRDRMLKGSFRKDPWHMFKIEWNEPHASHES